MFRDFVYNIHIDSYLRIDKDRENCVFAVNSKNGSGKHIQVFLFFNETEILFPEGTEFDVIDIDT